MKVENAAGPEKYALEGVTRARAFCPRSKPPKLLIPDLAEAYLAKIDAADDDHRRVANELNELVRNINSYVAPRLDNHSFG